ncbi:MAG TPA: hypothetical protein VK436_10785 [Methanocella sp.]|nr:hypothetical protein [Methanocella sp.]
MYPREITETSKSALLELGLALGKYHDDIVLAGGWAPYFLTKDYFQHCGSIDIDLALKTEIMPKYDTIRDILEDLGYIPRAYSPFQYTRVIRSSVDGKNYQIRLDLLCEKEGTQYIHGMHDVQQDLQACVFDGLELAFDFNFEQKIETTLPGNGTARTTIKILDLVGSLALKGRALVERDNPKDAYDIFALTYYNGGPTEAASYFNGSVSGRALAATKQKMLDDAFSNISYAFHDADRFGPFRVESFSELKYRRSVVAAQVGKFLDTVQLRQQKVGAKFSD